MKHNYKALTGFFKWIFSFFKEQEEWEYGTCGEYNRPARKHKAKGNVQFVLWKAGEHGHEKDYWHNFDSSWWPCFKPYGQHLKEKGE